MLVSVGGGGTPPNTPEALSVVVAGVAGRDRGDGLSLAARGRCGSADTATQMRYPRAPGSHPAAVAALVLPATANLILITLTTFQKKIELHDVL